MAGSDVHEIPRNPPIASLSMAVYRFGRTTSRGGGLLWRAAGPAHRLVDTVLLRLLIGTELPVSADIHPTVRLNDGGRGRVVGKDVTVGQGAVLLHQVTLGRDCTVEPFAIVYPGAKVLGGRVVGRGAAVGADAVVTSDVAEGVAVAGVPARAIGRAKPHEQGHVRSSA